MGRSRGGLTSKIHALVDTNVRCSSPTSATLLTNNLLFEDRCALPDQISFVLTLPWRAFIFVMGERDCTNLDKIAISVLSVTTKHLPHDNAPSCMNTDATAPRYHILDIAPLSPSDWRRVDDENLDGGNGCYCLEDVFLVISFRIV